MKQRLSVRSLDKFRHPAIAELNKEMLALEVSLNGLVLDGAIADESTLVKRVRLATEDNLLWCCLKLEQAWSGQPGEGFPFMTYSSMDCVTIAMVYLIHHVHPTNLRNRASFMGIIREWTKRGLYDQNLQKALLHALNVRNIFEYKPLGPGGRWKLADWNLAERFSSHARVFCSVLELDAIRPGLDYHHGLYGRVLRHNFGRDDIIVSWHLAGLEEVQERRGEARSRR